MKNINRQFLTIITISVVWIAVMVTVGGNRLSHKLDMLTLSSMSIEGKLDAANEKLDAIVEYQRQQAERLE